MTRSAKPKIATLLLLVTIQTGFNALAQDPEIKKEWTFHGENGALHISASSFPDEKGRRFTSLGIGAEPQGTWTVAEEAGSLDSVLNELPKAGFDLHSLSFIQFQLREADARTRLASYVAQSNAWSNALKTGSPAKYYPLVASSLNASEAYKEWNAVFNKRGLQLIVAGVEKVGVEPFSKSGAKCPDATNCNHLRVPNSAFVQMNIEPLTTK